MTAFVTNCRRAFAWVKEQISPSARKKFPTPDPIQSLVASIREVMPMGSKAYARRVPQGIEVGILWGTGFSITVFPADTAPARIVGWAYEKSHP